MASSVKELEQQVVKLTKLLESCKAECKAIRDSYRKEQQDDKQEYDKRIKAMFELGYQQALEDIQKSEQEFESLAKKHSDN